MDINMVKRFKYAKKYIDQNGHTSCGLSRVPDARVLECLAALLLMWTKIQSKFLPFVFSFRLRLEAVIMLFPCNFVRKEQFLKSVILF